MTAQIYKIIELQSTESSVFFSEYYFSFIMHESGSKRFR